MNEQEKTYIGKVEALEICQERGIFELPRRGKGIITCYATATGKRNEVIGKDGQGYFLTNI